MIDFEQHIKKRKSKLVKVLSKKEDSATLLMRRLDGTPFVLRIYNREIIAYQSLVNNNCVNLPHVYCCESRDNLFFVEEEYIDGISLDEMIDGGQTFEETSAKPIIIGICNALDCLHSKGFIHRDIKAEHVLLTTDGRTVLIDLDSSMKIRKEKQNDTQLLGTVGYAAPEQFGFSRSDERTDIYAVGILINEMLTGDHPTVKLYKEIDGLKHIIEKSTSLSPENRYQSILEIKSELGELDSKPSQSKTKIVICAVIVIVLVLVGAIVTTNLNKNNVIEGNTAQTVENTDYLQLSWGDGSTLYKNSRQGGQAAELFTEDGEKIDQTYKVYTDDSIGKVEWDEKWNSWCLSSNDCMPGDTGLIYAEKDGKKYAMNCLVYGEPTSLYSQLPDEKDLSKGYLLPTVSQPNSESGIISFSYNRGKDVILYLVSAPGFDLDDITCSDDSVSIMPVSDHKNYSYPISKLVIKNPKGEKEITVKAKYNQIDIRLNEK